MIESLIAAESECTAWVDIAPDKILRPIGTTFKEWTECLSSTEPPHWTTWKVTGYFNSFRGRQGDTLLYERVEGIEAVGKMGKARKLQEDRKCLE